MDARVLPAIDIVSGRTLADRRTTYTPPPQAIIKTLEEVTLSLKEASAAFTAIDGKPHDNNLAQTSDTLISCLMNILKYNAGTYTHSIWGIIAAEANYLSFAANNKVFATPPILDLYDTTILIASTTSVVQRWEALHTQTLNDRNLYNTTKV